ncbi:MAG: hypothetical protein Q9182_001373 [Xanthomendoza sp. 2 TL-2023]
MPPKDPPDGTNDRRSKAWMLDVQFRHLRYDIFEPVIDACFHASQHLASNFNAPSQLDYQVRQKTVRGTQYSLFRDIRLEDSRFENNGIHLRFSFACPTHLRQTRMLSSGHFVSGMLIALIGLDTENTISTTFLRTEICQSTVSMKPITGNHLRASVVASFVDPFDTNNMRQTLYSLKSLRNKEKFVIVEFPKVLVAGFYWILKHLQFLSSSNTEISFSNLITPSHAPRLQQNAPPAYSNSGSSPFDLGVLQEFYKSDARSPLRLGPDFVTLNLTDQEAVIQEVCSTTTLDHGQATALCENLARGLAFTQGPPGTGKTFLGVALAKVVLRHAPKPILVACMTNHALDNFLGDLVKQGITRIARIGGASKEEWTDGYTLPSIRKNFQKSEEGLGQKIKIDRAYQSVRALWRQGTAWCESLNTHTLTWAAVADHLKTSYPQLFSDISRYESPKEQKISDIRQGRNEAGGYAFEHWCSGRDLVDTEDFSRNARSFFNKTMTPSDAVDTLSDSESSSIDLSLQRPQIPVYYPYDYIGHNAWSMPMDVRAAWITRWKSELGSSSPIDKLVEIQRRYLEARKYKQERLDESDAKILANQEVIGLTTTACAKYWSMLKSLDLETLICEEAGEVSEAQTLTTLLPSVKHAIFIGDPLQLRPQVNQPHLSLENVYGAKYRLDESLFERMVMPRTSNVQPMLASKLDLQRRMHPDVAELIRGTIYPYLKDHPATSHSPIAGMVHRTFWLDHREPEDAPNPSIVSSKSYSNSFECAMVCELVRYLLNTNDFGSGEIAVLVPYSQQLACLQEKLAGTRTCSIALSDKDKEELIDMGLLDENEQSQFKTDVKVFPMVRLATIDGFQGEEAKVIILSTVRSNLQDRVGFLRITNRINVACSRARNGFYVIGNSTLLRTIDMTSPLSATSSATSSMTAAIDVAASARSATRTTTTANAKECVPNSAPAATSARPSATPAPARHVIYLASNLVSMVGIFLPCGHEFTVVDLDAQLELSKIYNLSTSGEILAMEHTMAEGCKRLPKCPKCDAALDCVPRYRHFRQYQLAPNTIECLYRKFGRKMWMFAGNVQEYRKNLQKGFEWFCDNFAPGPLTGKANAAMIKTRLLYITPVEMAITGFRDNVLLPAEKKIAHIGIVLGKDYVSAPLRLSFKLRSDLLYLHCRLTVLQEAANIIRFLQNSDDPRHTAYMAQTLRMHTIQQIDENLSEAGLLAEECRLKSLIRLEAEATLIQLCFDAVAESLGGEVDNLDRHERAERLTVENPGTAGILRSCYQSFDPYERGNATTAELWTAKTREFWEKWGAYEVGSLRYCQKGHPYSRKAFEECPECGGRKVSAGQVENRANYKRNLDRDIFLKVINEMGNQN